MDKIIRDNKNVTNRITKKKEYKSNKTMELPRALGKTNEEIEEINALKKS